MLDLDFVHQLKVYLYSWTGLLLDTFRFMRTYVDKKTVSKVEGSINTIKDEY